jgi:glyoxylase-like metal-dependent hydrolase (beta-lactamase superfamily II)
MAQTQRIAHDLSVIDVLYDHTPQVVGAYLLHGERPALIETGPTSTLETLEAGIRQAGLDPADLQAVAVTHIHLDHAGGAGALVRQFPHLEVYVHPVGAPHLIDPTKLVASAGRLYGDELSRLFGEVVPIPAERVTVLHDGDQVILGSRRLQAIDTPGHAKHHHAYWDPSSGDLFTGDIAGVALPGSRYVRAPTPPPELDLSAWQQSLQALRRLRPQRLLPTHFGPHTWVEDLLAKLEENLHGNLQIVQEALRAGEDEDAITERLRAEALRGIELQDGAGARARFEVIVPTRLSALGLIRYIRKSQAPTEDRAP